jgi:hypothetical protein
MELREFASSAKALARNPLGIIALFIVMVYAIAGLVISLARPEFYGNPYHPSVIFLACFPLCVLVVFAYLVSRHHQKLYGPSDFRNQDDFVRTFDGKAIPIKGESGIATSDLTIHEIAHEEQDILDSEYSRIVEIGYCLIHEAKEIVKRTSPRSGRYEARLWIEAIQGRKLNEIKSVTYKVWSDFSQDKFKTENAESNFDLWLRVYGEFPVLALVELKTGEKVTLQRYLDLPSRPPD